MSLPPLPRTRAERILWSVLEEHFEDAQYLFMRWEEALDGPDDSLRDLANGPERRLRAHISGLVNGGLPSVERKLFPALRPGGDADAFDERALRTTAALAILAQPVGGTERLIAAASEDLPPSDAAPLHRALELWDAPGSDRALWEASLRTRPESWPAWLHTFAIRGQPADENMVNYCLRGDEDSVLAALGVVPDMAQSVGGRVHDVLGYFFASREPTIRVAALVSALQVNSHRAWALCREWFASPSAPRGIVELMAILGSAAEHDALIRSVAGGHVDEARVWALGFTGRPYAAHLCVQLLRHADERIVRLAFEGLCWITGLSSGSPDYVEPQTRPGDRDLADPDGEFAAREAAEDAARDRAEAEAEAAGVDLDPHVMRLPKPKPEAVEAWWARAQHHFDPKTRYLHGRVATLEVARAVYVDGPSRRRHLLGRELNLRTRARVQPSTRAFALRQLRQLRELAELRVDPQRGYLDL